MVYHHYWQIVPFRAIAFLGRFCQIYPFLRVRPSVFTYLDFATIVVLQGKVVSLASNPNLDHQVSSYTAQW
jgi:hypothetical protein